MTNSKKLLTPKDLAPELGKSVRWVYRNWRALGGIQLVPGGEIFFENNIEKIIEEMRNAAQAKKREVSGSENDRRKEIPSSIRYLGRGKKMGSVDDARIRGGKREDAHGIFG